MKKERIGILTGGGDCAGLNPAIKWAVKTAMDQHLELERGVRYEVLGIKNGWAGLMYEESADLKMDDYIIPLDEQIVRTWDRYGGTMLGTSRTNPYNPENDRSKLVLDNIKKLGLNALIAIGGDDTLGVAWKLATEGVNVVGIPKTIDKDLVETDYTLGFETAMSVITEEVDRLRTTAGAHPGPFCAETTGRRTQDTKSSSLPRELSQSVALHLSDRTAWTLSDIKCWAVSVIFWPDKSMKVPGSRRGAWY